MSDAMQPTGDAPVGAEQDGARFLNPNDLPGGCQVSLWRFDDDGQPSEAPISLETPGTHNELTYDEAIRLSRALAAAAGSRLRSGSMARTARTAEDMPVGAEISALVNRWVKNRPGDARPWTDRFGRTYTDEQMDDRLQHGAVLDYVPTGPGRWLTTHMVIGTIIDYGDGWVQKRKTRHEPWLWHDAAAGAWYDDEWAANVIADGATVTYPERRR